MPPPRSRKTPSTSAQPSGVTPQAAAREVLRRRAARAHLLDFVDFTMPSYAAAPHHREIAAALEQVEGGAIDRLMVIAPPRHGKTELVSKRAPAWFLGRKPERQIIAASYGQDLARDFGREVRNIVASMDYRRVFPGVALAEDSAAADRWHTAQGGSYVAAFISHPVSGRGADCLPAGTLLETPDGPCAIEALENSRGPLYVLSYDEHREKTVYKQVQAFRRRPGAWLYRITTTAGRVVEATADHLFHTSRGWQPAAALTAGDTLVCAVRNDVRVPGLSIHKKRTSSLCGPLLLEGVFGGAPRREEQAPLRRLGHGQALT